MDSSQFVFDYVHQDALDGTGELAENTHFFTMNNDHGECMTSQMATQLKWAINQPLWVLNHHLGHSMGLQYLRNLMLRKDSSGIFVVCSAAIFKGLYLNSYDKKVFRKGYTYIWKYTACNLSMIFSVSKPECQHNADRQEQDSQKVREFSVTYLTLSLNSFMT